MKLSHRRLVAGAAVLLLVSTLTACQDDAADTPAAPPSVPAGHTTPGTTLSLGETATIPRTDGSGVLAFTVTAIEQGERDDLRKFSIPGADDDTPYYVHYRIELVSGNGNGLTMLHYLFGYADDQWVNMLTLSGPFSKCPLALFPLNPTPGTAVDSCLVFLADPGLPTLNRVELSNSDVYVGENSINWIADK